MSDSLPPRVPIERVIGWIDYLRANRERIHAEVERDHAFILDIIAKRKEPTP